MSKSKITDLTVIEDIALENLIERRIKFTRESQTESVKNIVEHLKKKYLQK